MHRRAIEYTAMYPDVMAALSGRGLLLGSYDAQGKANVMTIGWGMLGEVWGVPAWAVLVRASRYTCECIEHSACFSVNVPEESAAMACAMAGSASGRDTDKFALADLTAVRAETVLAPLVDECPLVYECQVVHSADILPGKLADEILASNYRDGDYHRIYYGKILAARAAEDAASRLAGRGAEAR